MDEMPSREFVRRMKRAKVKGEEMLDTLAATKSAAFCKAVRAVILIREMHAVVDWLLAPTGILESHKDCCESLINVLLEALDLEDEGDEVDAAARSILEVIYKAAVAPPGVKLVHPSHNARPEEA